MTSSLDQNSKRLSRTVGLAAFSAAFEASPTPMVVTDPAQDDNPVVWVNAAFLDLTGYAREEVYGRNCRFLQGELSDREVLDRIAGAIRGGEQISCELFNYRKDGAPFWNGMTITPVRDEAGAILYFFSAQADMTEKHRLELALKRANDDLERQVNERTADLQAALEQKTALLHEVDHRVKNNLQVISSLMLLKARRTPTGEARDALQSMADRIGALSTAHRMLYSAGDATRFDFREFTDDLVADLTVGLNPARIRIDTDIDALAVSAAMAAPLALTLHELATNAVRHAFPDRGEGCIRITARRRDDHLQLVIEDNGVGMAATARDPSGFGQTLVEMVVRQLRGTVTIADAAPGTRAEIVVPLRGTDLE